MEAKPYNVHVHTLCPGGVDTEFIKGTYLGERSRAAMINAEDIAEMVLFLLRQPENVDLAELLVRRFDPSSNEEKSLRLGLESSGGAAPEEKDPRV